MNEFFGWVMGLVASGSFRGSGSTLAPSWNGYVEADYAYVGSASTAGTIASALRCEEGDVVAKGAVLFTLSEATQQQRAARCRGGAGDGGGRRPMLSQSAHGRLARQEVDVIRASLAKARGRPERSREQTPVADAAKLFGQGPRRRGTKLDQDRGDACDVPQAAVSGSSRRS